MKFWAMAISLLILGCSSSEEELSAPKNLIPLDTFQVMMVDVQLLEASFNQKFFREDDPRIKKAEFYKQIFEKYNVSEASFDSSYHFYADQPEKMMIVYEYIITELSQREEKVNSSSRPSEKNDTSPEQ